MLPYGGLVAIAVVQLRRAERIERERRRAAVIGSAILLVVAITLLIGARGVAAMRSTSDFLVASRRISPTLNAAAVSGEYLSAASFLGVAGLVVKDGIGALWYPVGFTAGYVAMLALVAAPMRRTGALTVPDFAEARLGSRRLRTLSAVVVLVIATLYLVPQFKAAGQVLRVVSGTPYWVGVVVAGAAVSVTLALGGMRAATYVQAFQFVLKLAAVRRARDLAGRHGRAHRARGRAGAGGVHPVRPRDAGAVPLRRPRSPSPSPPRWTTAARPGSSSRASTRWRRARRGRSRRARTCPTSGARSRPAATPGPGRCSTPTAAATRCCPRCRC